ncbi:MULTISPECIES: cob(I)yrinic acid a,c-diamide adenosyltransferase [unclassified Thioalkalivibrio]|uniref:cob(I)yrinic acid a,c-diamide adenosyltransferase n=1 Tax=unclassified Thioalkalivibrio TaxID=2621013 RepID=UPI000381192F|nr:MULTISPECIES: cob(I)yrinic acid a,c-diamide adenosyltransferase [unclassified Thioalkalivibrio]
MTDDTEAARAERHAQRMARKKEIVDRKIAEAQEEKGVFLILTGNGKGKSSSGFGMVARALGHGMQVGIVQFIKGQFATGEEAFFRGQDNVQYHVMGEGYTWETQDREKDAEAARHAWAHARDMLRDPNVDLVLLDELHIALKYQYLDVAEVLEDLANRPPMQHVITTGRAAPKALIEAADTVSEIGVVKHAFQAGIKAQKGIEL